MYCKLCKTEKNQEEFYTWNKSSCRKCIYLRGKEACGKWAKDYPEKFRQYTKKWREENPEKEKENAAKSRSKNKESRNEGTKNWRNSNKDKVASYSAKTRAIRKNARIPLTKEQEQQIKDFYTRAKALEEINGIPYEVDHIHPLTHSNLCGLDVPWNLRVIPKEMNGSKKNKFDGTYENSSWKDDYLKKINNE